VLNLAAESAAAAAAAGGGGGAGEGTLRQYQEGVPLPPLLLLLVGVGHSPQA
jgi:hypothetical protein